MSAAPTPSSNLTYLDPGSKDFDSVAAKITKSYPNACIMYIQTINTPPNEAAYNTLKDSMPEPNETMLFHGSTQKGALSIIESGYNCDLNKRAVYGHGTYFTNSPALSAQYTHQDTARVKDVDFKLSYMLINKVLVGTPVLGQTNKYSKSVQVDSLTKPRIFAVPRNDMAIPTHIIAFYKDTPT
jgi:Poly(ADP-ribose) polymerase catalytic domain